MLLRLKVDENRLHSHTSNTRTLLLDTVDVNYNTLEHSDSTENQNHRRSLVRSAGVVTDSSINGATPEYSPNPDMA